MKNSLPFANLHRLTLLTNICINLFVLVLLIINKTASPGLMLASILKSFAVIYMLGLSNIFALYFVREKFPHSFKKLEWLRYTISVLVSLAISIILTLFFDFLDGKPAFVFDQNRVLVMIITFVIFYALTVLMQDQVILQHSKTEAELENVRLQAAVSEASNLLLRQQIHPHFLFNSLTILKSLYKKDSVKGEFYLTRLANFLRASVSSPYSKISLLQTELMLCLDYMEMQKIRFGSALVYQVNVSAQAKNRYVPFFSIQVLLENAIKHNMLTIDSPLEIKVYDTEGNITVENNLQIRAQKEVSTGQGLANLTERYKLLSGDPVEIKQNSHTFSVTIKMYENENCDY